jgi:predicted HTH transcriptional regulator
MRGWRMTNEHMQKLLAEGEDFAVEFKKNTNELSNTVFEIQFSATVNATANQILDAVRKNETISYDELVKRLSKDRTTIYRNIKTLKDKGILKRVGPDKSGHWEVME